MNPIIFPRCKIIALCWLLALLLSNLAYGQSDDPTTWKESELRLLQKQIAESSDQTLHIKELKSRMNWLYRWKPGTMAAAPSSNAKLPAKRQEPILESPRAVQLRDEVSQLKGDRAFKHLRSALSEHKNDIACLQTVLHWMDDQPTRRKQYLDKIEEVTTRLIGLLESSVEERGGDNHRMVLDFIRYRRARALVYRELPDVVAARPIKNQTELDRLIEQAFVDLFGDTGQKRTEFVLLQIRMLRRARNYGQALVMLETYGSTILPKWYQKKRRDLLKELGWDHPYDEAAAIYSKNFPAEVEKERQLQSQNRRSD